MNIGAESETDFGSFYRYGLGATEFLTDTYQSNYTGTESPLAESADTAIQVWGGNWRTPRASEFESLVANTNYEFIYNYNGSGHNGFKFTDKTDNSKFIFIPAAGGYNYGEPNYDEFCAVWSSTPDTTYSNRALSLNAWNSQTPSVNSINRKYGLPVRAVLDI